VVPPGALGVLPVGIRLPGTFRLRQGRGIVLGGRRGRRLGQAGAVGRDALLNGLGQVLPQVEPVGDLDCVRCPGPGSARVRARAVPADHLDPGMGGQPVRERLGVAAFDEVERGAGLDVDEQRAVVLAAPDREVIDPGHPRGRGLRVRDGHDQPQQDLPGRGDAGTLRLAASRDPARPASATAIRPSIPASSGVLRA
jgi:hypothetical protein